MGSTVTDALVGRLVDGRYEVLERIARGGMATVYLASDRRLDREVAVKVMHPHLADGASGADFVSRFRREARAAARLTHPGLVAVYDQGVDGETSYLTMEYIDGTNLRHRIQDEGPFTVADALDVVEHVLDDVEGVGDGERALVLDPVAQVRPVDVLHRQVARLAVDALVVDGDEAGVREPCSGAGLTSEARDEVRA